MSDLKNQLIRLGSENRNLRPHLRRVLSFLERESNMSTREGARKGGDVKFAHLGPHPEGAFKPGDQGGGKFIGEGDDSIAAAYDCFDWVGDRRLYAAGVDDLDRMVIAKYEKSKAGPGQKCYFEMVFPNWRG